MARRKSIWKGVVAGLAGGLVASWMMNEAQAGLSAVLKKVKQDSEGEEQKSDDSEDAMMKVAERISEALLNRPLNEEEKKQSGRLVHYAFGAAVGGLYGALAEIKPHVKRGAGLPFATALFVAADEIAVPSLGLSQPPLKASAQDHFYTLASRFAYGTTTELVRRSVRAYF